MLVPGSFLTPAQISYDEAACTRGGFIFFCFVPEYIL